MPTYTYQCKKCSHTQDMFHGMSQKPRVKCEECGSACKKLMGSGSGLIFKGSGFYETDYKNKGGKKDGGSSESKSDSAKSESGSGESKAESKADSKKSGDSKPSKGSDKKPAAASKGD